MLWRQFILTAAVGLCAFAADAATPSTNRPPTISGTIGNGTVGKDYYFLPVAKDPDGDALTFTLTGAPSWMKFRESDGRIVGSPPAAAIYPNIVLSVRDSAGNTVSLPPATVTITDPANPTPAKSVAGKGKLRLSWQRPTHNADGSVLKNLAGYRISYGTAPDALTRTAEVADPNATSYTIEGLTPGPYYFAIRSYRSDGSESENSNIATKTVK
jgi:hypothetical protein